MYYRFVEYRDFRLNNGVLIQGLPGIGLVGKIAVDYIVSELRLEKVAEFFCDGLLLPVGNAGVFVDDNGIARLPSYRFYLLRTEERDILFLAGEVQPVSWAQYEVAEKVIGYFREKGGVEVVGACGTTADGEEATVYYATADSKTAEELSGYGFRKSGGGTITGACGLLPVLASLEGLKGYVLMGSTTTPEPNPAAAREVIKALSKLFKIQVDLTNLETLIEEIKKKEEELRKLRETEQREKTKEGLPSWYV